MAYIEHKLVQDKDVIGTGEYLIGPKLDVLQHFTSFAPEQFFGQDGDTVSVRIPGALPARKYGWRNDRTEPIKTDVYQETKVDMTLLPPENTYSAVKVTDEQKKYDLNGSFGRLTDAQTTTLARDINNIARGTILDAPYELAIGVDVRRAAVVAAMEINQDIYFNAFIDAGIALDRLGVPFSGRSALVGSAVAAEIMKSQKLLKVEGNNSDSIFASASIGSYAGFSIVRDQSNLVAADEALVFDSSGFLFWSYAPDIPEGAVRGARSNKNGIGLRWIVDYSAAYQMDRSTWSTWTAFDYSRDFVQGVDTENNLAYGKDPFFVRGVKLIFKDGTGGWTPGDGNAAITNDRKGADPASELALYYNNQPLRTATTPVGNWYPNVLEGTVGIEGAPVEPVAP